MRFNLISNLVNGVGLQRDYELLKQELMKRGHAVQGVQFNQKPLVLSHADVNWFDEVVVPEAFAAAPVQWVMPHPEWWFAGWDQYRFDRVLAKTWDCERIFRAKVGDRCQYLGWMARDLYQPTVPRERKFLHVAGKSHFKNTPAVMAGCEQAGVPLTVIGSLVQRRVDEGELIRLMNSHFCQVMPSAYEGYGHVLHESQSVGQVLITTGAPPMDEVTPSFLVPSRGSTVHHAAPLHQVTAEAVCQAVRQVAALSQEEVVRLHVEARYAYQDEVHRFQHALDALVGRA